VPAGQLSAELFIYDTLPGGAGYARDIELNLEDILVRALLLSDECTSASCERACHRCLVDFKNQRLAGMLDRRLARGLLRFALYGEAPRLEPVEARTAAVRFSPYLTHEWTIAPGDDRVPLIFERRGRRVGLRPIHTLLPMPSNSELSSDALRTGSDVRAYRQFDLSSQPFVVLQDIGP
jgi:hypothetical protein